MQTSFAMLAGFTSFFFINTFLLLPKRHIPWPLPPDWGTKEDPKEEGSVVATENPVKITDIDKEAESNESNEEAAVEGKYISCRNPKQLFLRPIKWSES